MNNTVMGSLNFLQIIQISFNCKILNYKNMYHYVHMHVQLIRMCVASNAGFAIKNL